MKRTIMAAMTAAALAIGGIAVAAPAVATQPDFICEGYDSGKIDTVGDPATVEVTAPADKLISGYCVKAGTEKFFIEVNPPAKVVVVDHPEKDSVSHYSLVYVDEPKPEPITVRVNLTYMMDCAPDPMNTWRVRNPHTETITVTWRNAGNTLSGTHTATPGDSFFETPRGTETMIISWGGGDSGIVAGSQTKASGNDVAASDPKCVGPQPETKVEYGEWVKGEYDCDDTVVTETRDVFTTTYSLMDNKWVGSTVTTSESRERALTAEEIDALFCPGEKPEPIVEVEQWETKDCEAGFITTTTVTTTTDWKLSGEEWVQTRPVSVIEQTTREVTAEDCPPVETPEPREPSLPVTGGVDMTPFAFAGGAALLAGIALAAFAHLRRKAHQ